MQTRIRETPNAAAAIASPQRRILCPGGAMKPKMAAGRATANENSMTKPYMAFLR
jgi:hypothetical protein